MAGFIDVPLEDVAFRTSLRSFLRSRRISSQYERKYALNNQKTTYCLHFACSIRPTILLTVAGTADFSVTRGEKAQRTLTCSENDSQRSFDDMSNHWLYLAACLEAM